MSKSFSVVLAELNGGKLNEELTEAFAALVGDCTGTGKAGTIKLAIKVKPSRGGKSVTIEHDYDVKAPEFERPADVFFVDKGNDLVRNDPDQKQLPLRTVDRETGELRSINRESVAG